MWGLVVTSMWLFKPRSHGRKKEGARARNERGPVAGASTKFSACPIDRRLRLCARVGTQHLFVVVRHRSCVVAGAWSSAALLLAVVLCERVRCARRAGWRVRARCCPVAAAAAAAVCVLRLSRRRANVLWGVRARRLRGARAVHHGGVRLASCRSCGRGVASLCGGRCACGLPVPMLEVSLMPPQAVGALVTAVPPSRVVRVHGVAGGPRGSSNERGHS